MTEHAEYTFWGRLLIVPIVFMLGMAIFIGLIACIVIVCFNIHEWNRRDLEIKYCEYEEIVAYKKYGVDVSQEMADNKITYKEYAALQQKFVQLEQDHIRQCVNNMKATLGE